LNEPSRDEESRRRRDLSHEREVILDGCENPSPNSSETFSVSFFSPVDKVLLAVVGEDWVKIKSGGEDETHQFELEMLERTKSKYREEEILTFLPLLPNLTIINRLPLLILRSPLPHQIVPSSSKNNPTS